MELKKGFSSENSLQSKLYTEAVIRYAQTDSAITLVALVITIIVLLILAGVTMLIANDIIVNKAINASTKTTEAILKEQIQFAWVEVDASYKMEVKNNPDINKTDYFSKNLKKALENIGNIKDINISVQEINTLDTDEISKLQGKIDFSYKNHAYQGVISQDGEINFINILKGNVKVGEYIEYPVEYTDVYSNMDYTKLNGWRVIDDGVMEGTSGSVRIISTGIPAKWYYDCFEYDINNLAVEALINDFENLELRNNLPENNKMSGSYFRVESLADKVTTMTLADFNNSCNSLYNLNREKDDESLMYDKEQLFYLHSEDPSYYWIATPDPEDTNKMYYISEEGIKSEGDYRIGIRPVICLKDDISGFLENNIWKVIE